MKIVLTLILLFPLAGAVFNALVGRRLSRGLVGLVACGAVLGALVMSVLGLWLGPKSQPIELFGWISVAEFSSSISVLYDASAAVMALMVTFVAGIIHIYSTAFMRDDDGYVRYFVYLNLFVFAMLVITLADSLVFVYLGWEGVGFCSYALIGFWYTDPKNTAAGRKAFLLTRIGDVGFVVGLAAVFAVAGGFSIHQLTTNTQIITPAAATLISLLFMWAALGKSAQLPLSVWLPDAMAGPTPVSALIHAATMVTAGAYLLIRLFPVINLSPAAMLVIAIIGAVTALYSGFAALFQNDIKRILAYSTISQVSYLFMAVGAGDIVGSLFLLISHAFFKALLFLAAGCVIQALDEEHDIFKMGNLKQHLPTLYWLFLIGSLCLSAFPLIGGFFSKDRILIALFVQPSLIYKVLWFAAILGAMITPLYSMRLFFVAFSKRSDGSQASEIKSIPKLMTWILWPLAILALVDGLLNLPFGPGKQWLANYLAAVPGAVVDLGAPPAVSFYMGVMDAVMVLAVVFWSYLLFRPPYTSLFRPWLQDMMRAGFYLDQVYHWLFVEPYTRVAEFLWREMDENGLNRFVELSAEGAAGLSSILGAWNTGKLGFYIKFLLAGLLALLGIVILFWLKV